jgi:hypothetical protein
VDRRNGRKRHRRLGTDEEKHVTAQTVVAKAFKQYCEAGEMKALDYQRVEGTGGRLPLMLWLTWRQTSLGRRRSSRCG